MVIWRKIAVVELLRFARRCAIFDELAATVGPQRNPMWVTSLWRESHKIGIFGFGCTWWRPCLL